MRGRVGEAAVELRRPYLDTVEQRSSFEVERKRHDGDAACLDELRRQVGGRVGDDRDLAGGHGTISSGSGSGSRRSLRVLKKRSSIRFRAASPATTITVMKNATPQNPN